MKRLEQDEDELVPRGYTVKNVTWKDVFGEIADIVIIAGVMFCGLSLIWDFIGGTI